MSERELRGLAASGGVAIGRALVWRDDTSASTGSGDPLAALDAVAADLAERQTVSVPPVARTKPRFWRPTGSWSRIRPSGSRSSGSLPSSTRPRRFGRRRQFTPRRWRSFRIRCSRRAPRTSASSAVGRCAPRGSRSCPGRPSCRSSSGATCGPADVADLRLEEGLVLGIALAEGSATSHAAIMARAFGVPMTVGLGEDVLSIEDETVIVDGDDGAVALDPSLRACSPPNA